MSIIAVIVFISFLTLFVSSILAISLQVVNDSKTVTIFTDQDGSGRGWHCATTDWFWLRGMFSVLGCYIKRITTLGKFKFDWEVQ